MEQKKISDFLKESQIEVPQPKERGTKRNKTAGGIFERWCVDWFKTLGFLYVKTSRSESRSRDNDKIDLTNKDEHINGRLPYNVQCKNSCRIPDYHTIFYGGYKWIKLKKNSALGKKGDKVKVKVPAMPTIKGITNIIIHKFTEKEEVTGSTFNELGIFVSMKLEDFEQIVKDRLELEELRNKLKITEDALEMVIKNHRK